MLLVAAGRVLIRRPTYGAIGNEFSLSISPSHHGSRPSGHQYEYMYEYHGRLIRHAHGFSRHDDGSRFVGGDCLAGAQSHIKNYRWYDEHY